MMCEKIQMSCGLTILAEIFLQRAEWCFEVEHRLPGSQVITSDDLGQLQLQKWIFDYIWRIIWGHRNKENIPEYLQLLLVH